MDDHIKQVMADNLKNMTVERLQDDARLDDIGVDSLDAVEMLMALENAFMFRAEEEDYEKMNTVADVIALVKAKMG